MVVFIYRINKPTGGEFELTPAPTTARVLGMRSSFRIVSESYISPFIKGDIEVGNGSRALARKPATTSFTGE